MAITIPADTLTEHRLSEWLDRNSGRIMILPAVLILLVFAIFPLIISAYLSLSRFALAGGSFKLTFLGDYNFRRLLVGVQQYHLIGTFKPMGPIAWAVFTAFAALVLAWLVRFCGSGFSVFGLIGRLVTGGLATALVFAALGTSLSGGVEGTLLTTMLYVLVGVSVQFLLGLALALVCALPIRGRNLFRVIFFMPLMVTPVGGRLHVPHAGGYAERALRTAQPPIRPQQLVLGDRSLVGAADGACRRQLAVDAFHVHRAARCHREPAA